MPELHSDGEAISRPATQASGPNAVPAYPSEFEGCKARKSDLVVRLCSLNEGKVDNIGRCAGGRRGIAELKGTDSGKRECHSDILNAGQAGRIGSSA